MTLQEVKWMISLTAYVSTLEQVCGKGHCLSRLLEKKNSDLTVSYEQKKLSVLLRSPK